MNDRELLEFAAKAAGIKGQYSENFGDFSIGKPYSDEEYRWNPLACDGDALRLANALHFCVCHTLAGMVGSHGTCMVGFSLWNNSSPIACERYNGENDADAATRRAIVRAAATIGAAAEIARAME